MSNLFAPDGYRYGVMDSDGFVSDCWNGQMQRELAQEYADECMAQWPGENITLCRRLPYRVNEWERVV